MNGRAFLFGRCFIGLLAYFLCGLNLAYAAKYKSEADGVVTTGPVGYADVLYNKSYSRFAKKFTGENCSGAAVGFQCMVVFLWVPRADSMGNWSDASYLKFYFRVLEDDPCESKAGQSAGVVNVPIPGVKMAGTNAVLFNSGSFNSFSASGFPTCFSSCMAISDGPIIKNGSGGNVWGDTAGNAFMQMKMKYTGSECKDEKPDAPKPIGGPAPDNVPVPKPPKGPADCPPKTTFGEVNGVAKCVKNAPLPTDPSPPPKPDEKDTCIGNCDKWDPDAPKPTDPKDPKPTDPKPGPGGTTPPTKGPLSSDASKPASENASGPADSSLAASCTDFKCKNKDPATCEIARLAWNNKCIEEKAAEDLIKTDLYKNGNAAMSADGLEDMKKSLNFGENGTVDMAGVIKRDTFLNKSGLSDVSFTVMGKGFSLPFSSMNKYLSMMGKIAVAFSLLAAARILSSAV